MIRAIRANSATTGGDFRYTEHTWMALALAGGGFLLLWLATHFFRASSHLRFFLLFGYVPTAIVVTGYLWKTAIIPQPYRYQLDMDLALPMAIVFAGASILDRVPARVRFAVAAVVIGGLGFQTEHSVVYARNLIRSVEPSRLSEYKIAKWLDTHRPGERAFISGSGTLSPIILSSREGTISTR
jgi:hypothetical protein